MKKKILIIGPGMEIGGVERSLLGLLDSIDYNEYDVDLFLFSHCGELMPLINKNVNLLKEQKCFSLINYPTFTLFKKGHFLIGTIRLFSKLTGDIKAKYSEGISQNIVICNKVVSKFSKPIKKHYDIALGFFGPHYYLEYKVDADLKIGWVHTDYSNENELPDVKFTLPMWAGLDYIACVSEQVKTAFDHLYPSLRCKTIVIENILSCEFVRSQADMMDVSNEMPKWEGTNILSIGRFTKQKNFDNIPEVCSIFNNQGIPVKWYLIGYGQDEELIKSRIKKENVENTVIILGKKDNPYPYIKRCDIYVQPSRYEGKAVTVREAQMLCKPVIITNYKTSGSQVNDGVDGYICEMNNEGIAAGIKLLIENSELRESFIKNTGRTNYSNLEEFDKIIKLIETK